MDKADILAWAPIVISVAALLVAGLSMTISYRVFRRNVLSEEPLLNSYLATNRGSARLV